MKVCLIIYSLGYFLIQLWSEKIFSIVLCCLYRLVTVPIYLKFHRITIICTFWIIRTICILQFCTFLLVSLASLTSKSLTSATDLQYDDCPDLSAVDCTCSPSTSFGNVIILTQGSVENCISEISKGKPGGHYVLLSVENADSFELTDDFLSDVLFDNIMFENTKITGVHPDFLGDSSQVTERLIFNFCELVDVPIIEADELISLTIEETTANSPDFITLTSKTFDDLPKLEVRQNLYWLWVCCWIILLKFMWAFRVSFILYVLIIIILNSHKIELNARHTFKSWSYVFYIYSPTDTFDEMASVWHHDSLPQFLRVEQFKKFENHG